MKPRTPSLPSSRLFRILLSRSTAKKLLLAFFLWTLLESHIIYYRLIRTEREARAHHSLHTRRVFIASLHWNNEKILRSDWNAAVLNLVNTLGPDNVFVSVYESGSWDDSKGALRELDEQLEKTGVGRKIVLDKETHKDLLHSTPGQEGGWIAVGKEKQLMPRRIPYLSQLRNKSLEPLIELAENGTSFDHVLFLGDVVFNTQDILMLLDTNKGNYAAACSVDFSKPPQFYDTFALRDSAGHEHVSQTWPYFRSRKSRSALINGLPAPVSSCWNGIVVMPATAFMGIQGLKFRGVQDSLAEYHVEGSECCLIHADNPQSRTKGVFLNPNVRVGYRREAYEAVHPIGGSWVSLSQIWLGLWKNRLGRWLTTPWFKESTMRGRVAQWAGQGGKGVVREEKGDFCLINEMQVVVHNGWKHL
ncbi:cryptococcal mannosyltransferase 1-domain-containing protein [Triangularia setosa]|uniref:Cryptococcal mannosyltransferase 1-domain-containing protein n=1 Tax=Triangularia setosa TaxID=2587417 RepID=A0AAN6VYT6_9PEZI|nr:cryptococcal mannosyltransferase 1-domain-containing protein [Podospora setosa]